jgi:hypothetical protein
VNGRVDKFFVRENSTGKKPRLTGTEFALQDKLDVRGFGSSDKHYDHNAITGTNVCHLESNQQRRTNKASSTVCEDQNAPKPV